MRGYIGSAAIAAIGLCVVREASAQVAFLQPGDVALTCVDTSGTGAIDDHLQIMPLVPLPANVDSAFQLEYTDREADSSGTFDTNNENDLSLGIQVPLAAGEPFDYPAVGIGSVEEQVFLFQGNMNEDTGVISPGTLLWGFQISENGGWATMRTDTLSELPTVLASANVALATNGNAKFAYTGPTTGTKALLQASIADPANWTANAACPTHLTIIDSADAAADGDALAQLDSGDADVADTSSIDAFDGGDGSASDVGGTGGQGAGGAMGSAGASGAGGSMGAGGATIVVDAGAGGGDGWDATVDSSGGAPGADGSMDLAGKASIDPDASVDHFGVLGGSMGGATGDGASVDASANHPPTGCSCVTSAGNEGTRLETWLLAVLIVGLLVTRRRRQRPRSRTRGR